MAEGAWFFVGLLLWFFTSGWGNRHADGLAFTGTGIMVLALASHTGLDWWPL